MTENRQTILNHFKQGHLLETYEDLTQAQKDEFTKQLEKIPFDLIDMVRIIPLDFPLLYQFWLELLQSCQKIEFQ